MLKKLKDLAQGKAPLAAKRSGKWSSVRKHHLEKNGACVVCGDTRKLEVHHIKPFHLYPELELEVDNLLTMCESKSYGIICHLLIGHNGSYKNINPDVVADADYWRDKLKASQTKR